MNHRQRIEAALAGRPTDRPAWGYWQHFPNRDRAPRRLAELMLAQQKELDLDFIKLMPYGLFSVVDWGVELKMFAGFQDPPVAERLLIREPRDWTGLRPLEGDGGEYAVALEAQRLTLSQVDGSIPVIQTVFSPLTSALKMSGEKTLLRHLRESPEVVHRGLAVIAGTTGHFASQAVARGADGVFFASQMSTTRLLTPAEHSAFVKPYDHQVLAGIKDRTWFNILHLHGPQPMIDQVLDYPVQALSWHDRDSGPSLKEVRGMTDKCLVGGVGHMGTLLKGTPREVADQVEDAWQQVDGRGLIVAPGCGDQTRIPWENILQMKKSVLGLGGPSR